MNKTSTKPSNIRAQPLTRMLTEWRIHMILLVHAASTLDSYGMDKCSYWSTCCTAGTEGFRRSTPPNGAGKLRARRWTRGVAKSVGSDSHCYSQIDPTRWGASRRRRLSRYRVTAREAMIRWRISRGVAESELAAVRQPAPRAAFPSAIRCFLPAATCVLPPPIISRQLIGRDKCHVTS